MEFRSVLYVPGMAPLNNEEVVNPKTKNIRLYVKRVFISDDFDGELVRTFSVALRFFFGFFLLRLCAVSASSSLSDMLSCLLLHGLVFLLTPILK